MDKPPSWIRSVTSQFGCGTFGKLKGPLWFYLLVAGLLIGTAEGLAWRVTGALVMLSGVPTMIQETRRRHGAPLSQFGWWVPAQNLILTASGAVLAISGARTGWNNLEFALGSVIFVCALGFFLFQAVILAEEIHLKKR